MQYLIKVIIPEYYGLSRHSSLECFSLHFIWLYLFCNLKLWWTVILKVAIISKLTLLVFLWNIAVYILNYLCMHIIIC